MDVAASMASMAELVTFRERIFNLLKTLDDPFETPRFDYIDLGRLRQELEDFDQESETDRMSDRSSVNESDILLEAVSQYLAEPFVDQCERTCYFDSRESSAQDIDPDRNSTQSQMNRQTLPGVGSWQKEGITSKEPSWDPESSMYNWTRQMMPGVEANRDAVQLESDEDKKSDSMDLDDLEPSLTEGDGGA